MTYLERALRDLDCEFDEAGRCDVDPLGIALVCWATVNGCRDAAPYFDGEGRAARKVLRKDLGALGVGRVGRYWAGLRPPDDLHKRFRAEAAAMVKRVAK